MTARLVVLASGSGTNCQAIIDACQRGRLDAEVVAVVTNNPDAGVIARARAAGAAVDIVDHAGRSPERRAECDRNLIEVIASHRPDLVVLAGWMRILGAELGATFAMINLHPAKPGEFAGLHAIDRAYDAWQAGDIAESGVMVHWIPDGGVDDGPVIVTATLGFEPGESLADFEARLHVLEHILIVDGVRAALAQIGLGSGRIPKP